MKSLYVVRLSGQTKRVWASSDEEARDMCQEEREAFGRRYTEAILSVTKQAPAHEQPAFIRQAARRSSRRTRRGRGRRRAS